MNATDATMVPLAAGLDSAHLGFPLPLLEALLDGIGVGACIWDADLRLVVWNSAFRTIQAASDYVLRPGARLAEILDNGPRLLEDNRTGEELETATRKMLAARGGLELDRVLADGRTISVTYHPFAKGCWIALYHDVRNSESRVRHLARHDALTDLPNRLMFREIMEGAEQRIKRCETLAVLAIDLDRFKTVNDTLGHGVGDTVLRQVAERLRTSCREGDFVSRLGGDEFAIFTGQLEHPTDAATIADRVVRQIAEPFDVDGHNIMIGASVGIAVAPGDGQTGETLLKNADLALYRAKNDGRGAYHFFERGMDAILQERRALQLSLRHAIEQSEFRLVFQPLFNLKEGRVCCLEALLRWHHPERGTIAPNEFMAVAEDTGLIVAIGEWVLREACVAAIAWPDDVRVAVNLSAVQFHNRGLSQHIKAALEASGLRPDRLELEVTESSLLAKSEATQRVLNELRQLGVRISMANFGTGNSSLSYLSSFPFDKIKIDQSFVRDLPANEGSRAIVKAVIGLGRSLGMSTTAQGIETVAQLDLVRQQGCTEVQGFLLSPPLPGSVVTKLFAKTSGIEEWIRRTG